jgi:hypothetical protein
MPVELIQIPINAGQREDLDSRLMPDGLFKQVTNGRLRKTGELGVRLGYRALTASCFGGGTLKAFDVVSHGGSLLAFGSESSAAGGPEKVFTYSEDTTQWKGEDVGTRTRAFSAVSELKQVFRPPFVKTDEDQLYDIAYANGHVALVFEGHATEGDCYVHIFNPDTGAALYSATVTARNRPRVVGVGSVFVFAWRDSADDVRAATFTVGTSTALSAETVLHNTGTVGDGVDLAAVSGASEFLLLVVRSDTHVATIRRCTTALSVSVTGTLTDTDISLASVVSVSGGRTTVAYVDITGNYSAESFTTSTLASAVSPVSLFGGTTGTRPPGLVRKNSTTIIATAAVPDTYDQKLLSQSITEATLARATTVTFRETSQESKPFVSPDARFVGVVSPYGKDTLKNFTGIFDVENGRGYECGHHRGFSVDARTGWLGSVATDGTYYWAVFPVTDLNCSHMPVVMQFRVCSPERRQTAALGGLLYIAGGFVGCWDGQRTVEAGFIDAPIIVSATPSNGAGALTVSSLYRYSVAYDWYDKQGNRHLSPVSLTMDMTTGASDDTGTVVVTTPHSVRVNQGGDKASRIILYRTRAAPDTFERRTVFEFPSGTFAACVTLTDTASDDELLTQELVYTQGARGVLSGVKQHNAPFPSCYLAAGRDRITNGGLPYASQGQRSKRVFPGEPMNWSDAPGFFFAVGGDITAVFTQDEYECAATQDQIFVIGGSGPDDAGNGEFDAPRAVPGDGTGVTDWRSIVGAASGTWFQSNPARLYLMPRGGTSAEWLSQAVRDTLEAFPVITGGALCTQEQTVTWAVRNSAGTAGRLVSVDTRSGDWFVDTLDEIGSGTGLVDAICEHDGRLHLLVGGIVYRQDITYPAVSFIPMTLITGALAPQGTEGWWRNQGFWTTGTYKGPHCLEGDVSFDDGLTWIPCVSAPVQLVTGSADAEYSVDESTSLPWHPRRRKAQRANIRLRMTALSAQASEGQTLSNIQVGVIRNKKARRAVKQA